MPSKTQLDRINAFLEQLASIENETEVEAVCATEKSWLSQKYKLTSLGTIVSRYRKAIDQSSLPEDVKHRAKEYINLSQLQWLERNEASSSKSAAQGRSKQLFDPKKLCT